MQPQLEPPTAAVAQAEQETGQRAVRVGFGQGLDALPREMQERFVRFLIDLQARSDYMTFKYIVDNLTYHAVFPGMTAGQVSEIVNAAAEEIDGALQPRRLDADVDLSARGLRLARLTDGLVPADGPLGHAVDGGPRMSRLAPPPAATG